jgi:hypothetical protein
LVHLSGTQVFGDVVNPEVSLLGALSIVQTGQPPGVLKACQKSRISQRRENIEARFQICAQR